MNQEASSTLDFSWRRPQTFAAVAMAALGDPRRFFAQMPRSGSYLPPVAFFLCAMLVPTLVRTFLQWSQGPLAMLGFLASSLLKSLVITLAFALVLHGLGRWAFKSGLGLADVLRIVCYSSGVRVLEFLPLVLSPLASSLLAIFMVLFIAYLVWVGLQAAGGVGRYHALLALLLSSLAIAGLWLATMSALDQPLLPAPPPPAEAPAPPGAP